MLLKKKEYVENRLAEMVALVGGAMWYIEKHGNLNGYETYYMENKDKDGFHFRMQKYADKIIIKDFRIKKIHCRKWKIKTFYRYRKKDHNRIDVELYYYFAYIMDYILNYSVLTGIAMKNIFWNCRYKEETECSNCLDTILEWNYKRLIKFKTSLLAFDEKKKDKSRYLLNMLDEYPRFEVFRIECQKTH